jgi:hypothetical protein
VNGAGGALGGVAAQQADHEGVRAGEILSAQDEGDEAPPSSLMMDGTVRASTRHSTWSPTSLDASVSAATRTAEMF